jgi:hypothetical protein
MPIYGPPTIHYRNTDSEWNNIYYGNVYETAKTDLLLLNKDMIDKLDRYFRHIHSRLHIPIRADELSSLLGKMK